MAERKSSHSSDSSSDLIVIREIYDSENAQEIFEIELERAIQSGCKTIIIEPTGTHVEFHPKRNKTYQERPLLARVRYIQFPK